MKKILIIVLIVHLLPMLGVFMEDKEGNDKWYKYIYVLLVYILGLIYFIYKYDKYVGNGS